MKSKIFLTLLSVTGACFLFSTLVSWTAIEPPVDNKIVQASALKGFSLLQTTGAVFINKTRCASCHHATMTSMIAANLKKKGLAGVDTTAVMRERAMAGTLEFVGNPNFNNQFVSAKFLAPYVLLGLDAEKYPGDFTTDITVNYVMSQALPNGSFKAEYARVPLECGDVHLTALSIHAIQLYAPPSKSAEVHKMVGRTKTWIEEQHLLNQQELAFQLMGMQWCGSTQPIKTAVAQQLVAMQNKDGGWSQLPGMASDAYATGQALYALAIAVKMDSGDEVYQKGIRYLLSTQDKTGAWLVNTRSNPIQPFVNSDFPPYDDNQFISAAATNWAVLALTEALPDSK